MKVVDVRYNRFWNIEKKIFKLFQKIIVVDFGRVFDVDISNTVIVSKILQLIDDMNHKFICHVSKNIWNICSKYLQTVPAGCSK